MAQPVFEPERIALMKRGERGKGAGELAQTGNGDFSPEAENYSDNINLEGIACYAGPLSEAYLPFGHFLKSIMLLLPILGSFWCSVVTLVPLYIAI